MAYKRKQISITAEDYDLLDYVEAEGKGNESKFILKCVRFYKDYKNNPLREEKIIELIEQCLKKQTTTIPKVDRKVADSVRNILNLT